MQIIFQLFTAIIFLIFPPKIGFTISATDINNNPDSYKKVCEFTDIVGYVDNTSVVSLRYSPPYYTLKGKAYIISYNNDIILEQVFTADYNYKKTFELLLKKELLNSNNQKSAKETINLIQKQVMADPGIITGQTKGKLWTIDGTFKCDVPDMQGRTANYGTAAYYIANYMFFKYYGDYFQPYIQQE